MKAIKIKKFFIYVTLFLILFVTLIPLLYTFSASFKSNMEMLTNPASMIPKNPTLDNYIKVWQSEDFNFFRMYLNSIMYTLVSVFTAVFISSMAGYAFAVGRFKFKKLIFTAFSSLLFIKLGSVSIYATFDVLNLLHIKRSLYSLMLIHLFSVPVVNIYLVRSFVFSLPGGIIEAAKIDGCTFFTTFLRIILPLLKPVLATIAILSFKNSWNDYLMPTIFTLTKPEQRTVIVGLLALKNSDGAATNWNLMLAGSVVSMLPVIIAYICANKYFVNGIAAGAVKG